MTYLLPDEQVQVEKKSEYDVIFEIVLDAGGILLGLYGILALAFQILTRWRSGRLRDDSLHLAVAFVVERLGWAVFFAGLLLMGMHRVAENVWRTDLHTLNLWGYILVLGGLLIYTIGYFCEGTSPVVRELVRLWALPTWDSEPVADNGGAQGAHDDGGQIE